eukprot:1160937-Pelagomonas_calceolata.AAC.1
MMKEEKENEGKTRSTDPTRVLSAAMHCRQRECFGHLTYFTLFDGVCDVCLSIVRLLQVWQSSTLHCKIMPKAALRQAAQVVTRIKWSKAPEWLPATCLHQEAE